jgi:hypothetical protein
MKTSTYLRLLFLSSLCFLLISSSESKSKKQSGRDAEIAAVKSSIHATIGWAKNKDFKLLYNIIANDTDYLEVDPGNRLISDLTINLSEKGDVAWFNCIPDDINEWKGLPVCWMNTGRTVILKREKVNGLWFRCIFLLGKINI